MSNTIQAEKPGISIVIPLYNEELNVEPLYREILASMEPMGRPFEIIFVDDGSIDGTFQEITKVYNKDGRVHVISLLGNQGQTAALHAGFKYARGNVIVAIDGDGQHDPADIPAFVQAIDEGYDVASCWKIRDEARGPFKRSLTKTAHGVIRLLVGVKMNYFGATMKAYRSEVLGNLDLSGDLHRFAGALISFKGIRIKEVPITFRKRNAGTSNYGFTKIFRVLLDLILIKFLTSYARAPFRVFGSFGVILGMLGGLAMVYVFYQKYFMGIAAFQNTAIIELGAIAIVVGIQFIFFGLIAEIISRLYYTSQGRELTRIKTYLPASGSSTYQTTPEEQEVSIASDDDSEHRQSAHV